MSWSVAVTKQKPVDAKEQLASQFANARSSTRHIPSESRTVAQAEELVNTGGWLF